MHNRRPSPFPPASSLDFTEIHYAALFGDVDYAQALLDAGLDVNAKAKALAPEDHPKCVLSTPLACAAHFRHEEMARLLVSRGLILTLRSWNKSFSTRSDRRRTTYTCATNRRALWESSKVFSVLVWISTTLH